MLPPGSDVVALLQLCAVKKFYGTFAHTYPLCPIHISGNIQHHSSDDATNQPKRRLVMILVVLQCG